MTARDDGDADALVELLAEVRRIEVQSTRLVTGTMAGSYASVFRGAGVEFDEVREYVEGDDPRQIDWNVTARVGRPFVKKYVDERELTVVFVLDQSPTMRGGFGPWSARQIAARVCATLALSAARNHDKVGLVACGDGAPSFVRPTNGRGHALRIVRDVLASPDASGPVDLAPALDRLARTLRRHATVFVLSDFLAFAPSAALDLCARRHDVVAVRLLLPELDAPALGLARMRGPDGSAGVLVDWSRAHVRDAYAQRVSQWRQRTETALRRARVDVLDVPVPAIAGKDVVGPALMRFFRMREQRGAKR